MTALSVIGANLITAEMAPLTITSGGNSKGNPGAGSGTTTAPDQERKPITTSDRAGAGILTFLVAVGVMGGSYWIIS